MKRCGHEWSPLSFGGDPFQNYWDCEITERCVLCKKERIRQARREEVQTKVDELTCSACGFLHCDHGGGAGHGGHSCLGLLATKVRDLEERLSSLEDWRHR